jgi:hypothetical protein
MTRCMGGATVAGQGGPQERENSGWAATARATVRYSLGHAIFQNLAP